MVRRYEVSFAFRYLWKSGCSENKSNLVHPYLRTLVPPKAVPPSRTPARCPPRLFKAPSLWATGVFRAATEVAAAPQRGANPPFATEERGLIPVRKLSCALLMGNKAHPYIWVSTTLARTPLPAGEGLGERPLHQRAEVMKPASAHDGAAQQGNTFGRSTGSSGGY